MKKLIIAVLFVSFLVLGNSAFAKGACSAMSRCNMTKCAPQECKTTKNCAVKAACKGSCLGTKCPMGQTK